MVVHGFGGVEVGVVGDAAVFVGADALALHDPLDGGLAVHYVVVGFQGNVAEGDAVVVEDGGFVVDAFAGLWVFDFGEFHFFDAVVEGGEIRTHDLSGIDLDGGVAGDRPVVQVPVGVTSK